MVFCQALDYLPGPGVFFRNSGSDLATTSHAPTSNLVLRFTPGGNLSIVAGNGISGYSGDNGPAVNASLGVPVGLAIDAKGNLYIGEYVNHRVRKVTPGGIITTFAGNGRPEYSGDGGPAVRAGIGEQPNALATDESGNVYIADLTSNRVRKVTPDGVIQTIAGTGQRGALGDGG